MTTQPPMPPAPQKGMPRWALVVLGLAGAFILIFLLRPLIFPTYFIPSQAMAPTIVEGDRVMARTFATGADRGDVIIFDGARVSTSTSSALIKRVVATEGETIEFRDGVVFVDGQQLDEPYLAEQGATRTRSLSIPGCVGESSNDRCVVPDDHVFVMGDNRINSQDSRVYGPVPTDSITSKVFMKVMPLGDIGGL